MVDGADGRGGGALPCSRRVRKPRRRGRATPCGHVPLPQSPPRQSVQLGRPGRSQLSLSSHLASEYSHADTGTPRLQTMTARGPPSLLPCLTGQLGEFLPLVILRLKVVRGPAGPDASAPCRFFSHLEPEPASRPEPVWPVAASGLKSVLWSASEGRG